MEKLVAKGVLSQAEASELRRDVNAPASRNGAAPLAAAGSRMRTQTGCEGGEQACTGQEERRRSRRAAIAKPARVRPDDRRYKEEIRTTDNASREGLYFTTWAEHYYVGMRLHVTFPYASVDPCNVEHLAEVVRMSRISDGRTGVGIRFLLR
jgi:hypothetical protein